jgi:hypothetical protein
MNTTAHPVAPEEIMALLDGELASAEAQSVSAHLAECAECAAVAEQFRGVSQAVSGWQVPEAPSNVDEAIAALAAKTAASAFDARPPKPTLSGVWNWKRWAVGVAMAATILLAVRITYLNSRPQRMMTFLNPDDAPAGFAGTGILARSQLKSRTVPEQKSQGAASGEIAGIASEAPVAPPRLPAASAPDSNGLFHGLGDHAAVALQSREGGGGGGGAHAASPAATALMIARTATLNLVVKDIPASRAQLDAILTRYHGYVAKLDLLNPENLPRGFQASLRIPAPDLAAALNDLRQLGALQAEQQAGEEVTQQHADLVARLKNSRETEERLRAILQQRTGKIDEVLQVEEEIARVRGEIEQMEAEQEALEHRVDFASVQLELSEVYKAQLNSAGGSAANRMENALVAGLHHAAESLLGIFLFLAEFGPAILIWLAILGVPAWLVWRRYRGMHARD